MKIFLSTTLAFLLAISVANAAYTITGTLSTDGSIPKAPASVIATKSGDTTISITWTAVVGVEGYKVYKIKNGGTAELVANYGSAVLTYINSDLSDGNYSYQVQPFLGTLSPDLNNILPTLPVSVVASTPTPTPSGGGGGGGGGSAAAPTPTLTPTPTPLSEAAKKVDANKDGKIDVLDFNTLMVNWGTNNPSADFDGNGVVDVFDFNMLMINWTA